MFREPTINANTNSTITMATMPLDVDTTINGDTNISDVTMDGDSVDANTDGASGDGGNDNGNGKGDGNSNSGKEKKRSKARPRLTVQGDVMERLRKVAVEREMTVSELAEELLSQYVDQVPDEELYGEGDAERNGEEEKKDATTS